MNITGVAKSVAKSGLKFVNSTGEGARKITHNCINKITKKSDDFVKTSEKALNKDTAIGGGIIAGVAALAVACIKGIADKIKEVKEK